MKQLRRSPAGEEVKAKLKQLFDIVKTIEEIVNALEDHELVAMRDEDRTFPHRWSS